MAKADDGFVPITGKCCDSSVELPVLRTRPTTHGQTKAAAVEKVKLVYAGLGVSMSLLVPEVLSRNTVLP